MRERDYSYEAKVIKRLSTMSRAEAADLRRSLAHPPGEYVPAMRVLEYFFGEKDFRRVPTYIVAGLFADIWRPPADGREWHDVDPTITVPRAMRSYVNKKKADARAPLERRFLTLIDTSLEGVTVHMRPILRMISQEGVSWSWTRLLYDVSRWTSPNGNIQHQWAREFYRAQSEDDREENHETTQQSSSLTTS